MAMKWKCLLDPDKILTGYQQLDETLLQPGDVAFDVKPDLAPGFFRWNGERFDPAHLGQAWYTPPGPDSWYAVFRALAYLQRNFPGVDFPPPVKQWLKYYYDSFKRVGDIDPER